MAVNKCEYRSWILHFAVIRKGLQVQASDKMVGMVMMTEYIKSKHGNKMCSNPRGHDTF
jgi:hypothetical protein